MKKVFHILVYIFAGIGFILVFVYLAVEFGWTNTEGIVDEQRDYFQEQLEKNDLEWTKGEEWQILKEAILKDQEAIEKVAKETGIPSRLIVAPLVVEQLRLFHSEREIFKSIFAPLKILGNQSQFSWGVMGIKQETARKIENNLKNPDSPWYLGKKYEKILDFTTNNPDNERFLRLTDEDNRYYSYLYSAILIKQLETQWEKVGFPIHNRPGIVATLFNIGFANSKPHNSPQLGGAEIEINKTTYSFGGLAQSFYDSNELVEEFPR